MFLRSKKIKPEDDQVLVHRYRNSHDSTYVGELFQRYTHLVFAVCMKYLKNEEDSKDAVMEIFEKILVELKKHDVQNFKGWLHSVTRNHCLMKIRADKTKMKNEEEHAQTTEEVVEINAFLHPSNDTLKEEELNRLEAAMKELNEEQRQCIELFYLEKKCYKEVAEHPGYELKKVKSHIQNGKRNLKNILTTDNDG